MNVIINFLLQFLFGVRVEGEPINLEYGTPVSFTTSDQTIVQRNSAGVVSLE